MSGKEIVLCLFIVIQSVYCSDYPPVAIWGTSSAIRELEPASAGEKTSLERFTSEYVDKILNQKSDAVVVFVQDVLSIRDFSQYGDAYNANGHGGAFKKLKTYLDDTESLMLPAAQTPAAVVDHLRDSFPGRVVALDDGAAVDGVVAHGNTLYVVRLPATMDAESRGEALRRNDVIIGKMIDALTNEGISYTAFYTARGGAVERTVVAPRRVARQLLAANTSTDEHLFNISGCLFLYTTEVALVLRRPTYTVIPLPLATATGSCGTNNTNSKLTLDYAGVEHNDSSVEKLSIAMNFSMSPTGWWVTMATLSLDATIGKTSYNATDLPLNMADATSTRRYSYHCTRASARQKKPKEFKDYEFEITFADLQVQPLGVPGDRFSGALDCVGWFTVALWEGILVSFLFLGVLSFGLYLLSTMKSMDRFDDPKGKTITVPLEG